MAPYTITDALRYIMGFQWRVLFLFNGSLETFCLERSEYLTFGVSYYGTIDPYAIEGGVPGGHDPVDARTTRLYNDYLSNMGSYNDVKKTALQLAIWKIEAEVSTNYSEYSGILSQTDGTKTIGEYAEQYYNQYPADTSPVGGIAALNLWENPNNTGLVQSLLTVPEPGILILLGIAMSAIGAASWRIRKI